MYRCSRLLRFSGICVPHHHPAFASTILFANQPEVSKEVTIKSRKRRNLKKPKEKPVDDADIFGIGRSSDIEQEFRVKNADRWSRQHLDLKNNNRGNVYHERDHDDDIEFQPLVINKQHPDFYVDMCAKLASKGKLVECVAMLETRMLKEDRVVPTIRNFNVVLKPLAHVGHLKTVLRLHRLSEDLEIKSSMATYTCLLTACSNSKDKRLAMQVVPEVKQAIIDRHRKLMPIHFNAIINCYNSHNEMAKAMQTFDEMVAAGIKPMNYTFGHLLDICANNKINGMGFALKIWQDMVRSDVKPVIQNFTSLITTCHRCDVGFLAENLTAETDEHHTSTHETPLLQTGNEQMMALAVPEYDQGKVATYAHGKDTTVKIANQKNLEEIAKTSFLCHPATLPPPPTYPSTEEDRLQYVGGLQGIFAAMKHFDITPNHHILSALLHLLPNNEENERILFGLLHALDIFPDVQFFNQIIVRRVRRFAYQQAREVMEMISFYKLTPDVYTFAGLAMCCTSPKHIQDLFNQMKTLHVSPNAHVMLPVLKWTLHNHEFAFATRIIILCKMFKIRLSKKFIASLHTTVVKIKKESNMPSEEEEKFMQNYNQMLKTAYIEVEKPRDAVEDEFEEALHNLDVDELRTDAQKPWVTKSNVKYE